MTDKEQLEALELASAAESAGDADYPTAKKANAYYLCLLEDCAHMIRELDAYRAARAPADSVTAPAGGAAVPDDWPTDDELDTVLCNQWPAFSMQATLVRVWVRAAMRDALAKWGTQQPVPASAAEFALRALVAAGHVTQERVDQAMALPGAPAQPVAAPLTDEQRNAIYDKHCFLGDNGWEINWWQVIDEVEAAHGIKGGQHGAE